MCGLPNCSVSALTGRQHLGNLSGRIGAACQGAVCRGNPHLVAREEKVLQVRAGLTPHLRHRPKHAGRGQAHGFRPAVHASK